MSQATMNADELREEFRRSIDTALSETDFVSAEEAREIVHERLDKADVQDDEESDETAESVRDGDDDLLDALEEEGVPQDLIDACAEHMAKAGVEKALDTRYTDEYLAESLDKNAARFADGLERGERASDAAAEAVSEETPLLDATVYDDEEGM